MQKSISRRIGSSVLVFSVLVLCAEARAQFVAAQVTPGNAATHLFGGTDADGGIDDWYVSNGVVEAIVDDAAPQADLIGLLGAAAPPKANEAAFTGGSLLDLGLAGADNDQLGQLFTVGGLSTSNFILYDSIVASTTASSATLSVSGNLLGFEPGVSPADLDVVTEYTAAGSDPFLTVTTTVTNNGAATAVTLGGFIDAIVWTQRAVVPFSPLPDRGFNHAELDFNNLASALELPAFAVGPGNVNPGHGVMDPPSGGVAGEVSYGFLGVEVSLDQDGPGGSPPIVLPTNTLLGVSSNLVTAFGNVPAAGGLNAGGILSYKRRLYVGDRNDVASAANDIIEELAARQGFSTGTLSGDVDAVDTTDVVASAIATRTGGVATPGFATGAPTTHFRTDPDGGFSGIVLPAGTYDVEFRAVNRQPVTVVGVVVAPATDTPILPPLLSGLGSVELQVREIVKGFDPDIPAKVTFVGIDGTPDPVFNKDFEAFEIRADLTLRDLIPETFPGGFAQRNFVYLADGTETVQVPEGKYEVFATRGPEYTSKRRKIRVREGKTKRATFRIRRVVDTTGALSADFHIHSARSFDNSATLVDRVASFVGEQVEVMVSTDHDYHVDYAPVIAAMGLGAHVNSIVGNEVTTSVPNEPAFPNAVGHINAWPVTVDATAPRDGSIEDEYVAPNFIFSRLRAQGARVIQYNHPRAGVAGLTSIGFFNNIGFDPDIAVTSPPNDVLLDDDILGPGGSGVFNPDGLRNLDFDAMEILNGTDIGSYLEMRRDWFSLLNQADGTTVPVIWGTGVSDSHRITIENAGYARAYVLGSGDDPAALDPAAFDAQILAGRVMSTTGPYLEVSLEDSLGTSVEIGGTLVPSTSDVLLNIRVQATNWIPVEEVRIYRNGFLEASFDEDTTPGFKSAPKKPWSSKKNALRFETQLSVTLGEDSYFVVEAGARLSPLPTAPEFIDTVVPGMVPLAFTNPIFVDLGGDGFDPPGLPIMAGALAASSSAVSGEFNLERLSAKKRESVMEHFPLHRIEIPESAVADLLP